jgi:hypothetical protein
VEVQNKINALYVEVLPEHRIKLMAGLVLAVWPVLTMLRLPCRMRELTRKSSP